MTENRLLHAKPSGKAVRPSGFNGSYCPNSEILPDRLPHRPDFFSFDECDSVVSIQYQVALLAAMMKLVTLSIALNPMFGM
jgi:hypothetical protein